MWWRARRFRHTSLQTSSAMNPPCLFVLGLVWIRNMARVYDICYLASVAAICSFSQAFQIDASRSPLPLSLLLLFSLLTLCMRFDCFFLWRFYD